MKPAESENKHRRLSDNFAVDLASVDLKLKQVQPLVRLRYKFIANQ